MQHLDFSTAISFYTNDAHVTSTGSEVILTLGVRPLASGVPATEIPVQRIYMTFYTAKRFQHGLQMSLDLHVRSFGQVPEQQPSESVLAAQSVARVVGANFVRVSPAPEELVVEFGLDSTPFGSQAADSLHIHSQVVLTFATASSLWQQLSLIIREYETRHGDLELDAHKRVR